MFSEEDNLDSDEEDLQKVDSAWHGDVDSDADSLNSDEEDPLKWGWLSIFIINNRLQNVK